MVIVSQEGGPGVDPERLEADGDRLLEVIGRGDAELSVLLADDSLVRSLNAQWRGIDAPTDVLSFPQDDERLLGDVVISTETAGRQAAELGHALDVEVRVLLVHGLLHLLGQDHELGDAEAAAMRAEEVRLLAALGVPEGAALVGRHA